MFQAQRAACGRKGQDELKKTQDKKRMRKASVRKSGIEDVAGGEGRSHIV